MPVFWITELPRIHVKSSSADPASDRVLSPTYAFSRSLGAEVWTLCWFSALMLLLVALHRSRKIPSHLCQVKAHLKLPVQVRQNWACSLQVRAEKTEKKGQSQDTSWRQSPGEQSLVFLLLPEHGPTTDAFAFPALAAASPQSQVISAAATVSLLPSLEGWKVINRAMTNFARPSTWLPWKTFDLVDQLNAWSGSLWTREIDGVQNLAFIVLVTQLWISVT